MSRSDDDVVSPDVSSRRGLSSREEARGSLSSRLASGSGVCCASAATRDDSHIEHVASERSLTCAHVAQLHVGESTAGDAVAVAAEAKRTGILFRAKFWPAQQRAMLPFPSRRGRASRGVGEVGASLGLAARGQRTRLVALHLYCGPFGLGHARRSSPSSPARLFVV